MAGVPPEVQEATAALQDLACRFDRSEAEGGAARHAELGFTTEMDPERVADRRDTYVGQQITILDNRRICQHSGYCTDRLATVFHLGEEPQPARTHTPIAPSRR